MAVIVLVRHGESLATVDRVIGGPRSCRGLSELGKRQSTALAERWSGEHFHADLLVASQYRRAVETAELVAPALGLPVQIDARFGEIDPGPSADGVPYDEFFKRFDRSADDWDRIGAYGQYFPDGETVADLYVRVAKGLAGVAETVDQGVAVICCHGGVIDAALRRAMEAPLAGGFRLFTTNASITEVWTGTPWRLVRYNDAAHLSGLKGDSP